MADRIAGDALFGLSAVEDLYDAPEPASVSARVSAEDLQGPRKALPNGDPAPAPAMEPEPQVVYAEDAPAGVSPGQLEKMGASMSDLGVKDRADRLTVTSHIVGRDDRVGEGTDVGRGASPDRRVGG